MMEFRSLFKNIFGHDSTDINKTDPPTQQVQYLNDYQQVFFSRSDYSNDILIKTCIDVIAKHCAKLRANHLILKDGMRTPVTNSNLNEILTLQPNPYMSAYDFFYKVAAQAFQNQNAYVSIQRDPISNEVIALWPLDYMSVEAREIDSDIYLKFSFKNGQKQTLPYSDVIHIRHNFQDGELIAHSDDNLQQSLALLDTLQQSFANSAINSGKIKGVAKISGQTGTDAWNKKAKLLNDSIKNPDTGGIVATDGTIDFVPCNSEPIPADHTQLEYVRGNIYKYYGVSKQIVDNKYGEDEWQAFYESTIEPFAIAESQEFTRKLFTPQERMAGNSIFFDANRLAYANTATKTELIRQLRPLGVLTTNQCLEVMNLPPVTDGENRVQTLNVVNTKIVDQYQQQKTPDPIDKGVDDNDGK